MPKQKRLGVFALVIAFIAVSLLVVFLRGSPSAQLLVFAFLWILPTLSWTLALEGNAVERLLIASGLSFLLVALVVLMVGYLPGPVSPLLVLLGVILASTPAILIAWSRVERCPSLISNLNRHTLALVGILLLALFLRITNLGYKEFQGDEGVIMVRAASMLDGDEGEIFIHQKGPVEILFPAAAWTLGGIIDDYWPRLPFTLAGLLEVLAIYWLARMWFGRKAGLVACLLFAISGFGIAFSRIVQYQSFVMFWGTLSLITAQRYRDGGERKHLLLSSIFIAGGLLAHYDAILVLPAVLSIVLPALFSRHDVRFIDAILAFALGILLIGVFYLPFALSPNASQTLDYLLVDRVTLDEDASPFGWSGAASWRMATFYNSIWYVLGISILSLVGVARSVGRKGSVAALLYFLVPLIFYLVVVGDPRTHVYTVFPGAIILAGLGAAEIWTTIKRRDRKSSEALSIGIASLWLVVVALYPALMFVDVSKERQRSWDENKPLPILYPVTWDEPPVYGLFGFPHQAGWRAAVDVLQSDAYPYSSNEEEEITNWYMAQGPRTHCTNARSVLIAENAQDEVFVDAAAIDEFTVHDVILVNGEPGITILGPGSPGEVGETEAINYQRWLTPEEAVPSEWRGSYEVDADLDGVIRLLGYDLDPVRAIPGEEIVVTLYWKALAPISQNKQVFVHLYDGTMWSQHDSAPECAINPTSRWEPGQIIADPHILELPSILEGDEIPLLVGMYDLLTGDRMVVEETGEDFVHLVDLEIIQ